MPPMPGFAALRRIGVRNGPGAPPFDVRGLRQFPQLAHVTLEGALTGLEALADLPLVGLGFRLVPDLGGLPSLASWPELKTFSAVDSDAAAAPRLRAEHRGPVTRPRERAWFLEEYGLPFGAWPTRTARAATKAFRAASAEIRAIVDRDAGLAVIEGFTRAANGFGGIETVQREDLATAVALLAGLADPPLDTATAIARFDAVRDF
jgi:hypothetical protein